MRKNADKRSVKRRVAEAAVFLALLCLAGLFAKGRYEQWHAQQPYPAALRAMEDLAQTIPEAELTEDNLNADGFPRNGGNEYVFRLQNEGGTTIGEIELAAVDYDSFGKPLFAVSEMHGELETEIYGSIDSSFTVDDHGYGHNWIDTEETLFPGMVSAAGVGGLFTDLQILPGDGYTLVNAQCGRVFLTVPGTEDEAVKIRTAVSEALVMEYDEERETVSALEMTEPLFLENDQAVVFTRSSHGRSDDRQKESETCYYVYRTNSGHWIVRCEASGEASLLEYAAEEIPDVPEYELPPKGVATSHKYYVMVNRQMNTVTVYIRDGNNNFTIPYKVMICSTGSEGHETPVGNFSVMKSKAEWCCTADGTYGHYTTAFLEGGYLFHSVCYTSMDSSTMIMEQYNMLGDFASAGSILLQADDAKWIYENCEAGTGVTIYDSPNAGPYGKPEKAVTEITEENNNGWDPTDHDPDNPWYKGN